MARELQAQPGSEARTDHLVGMAVEHVDGCTDAGVCVTAQRRRAHSAAATSDRARRADELQYALGEGPVLEASLGAELVHCTDLTTETRWPRWAPAVVEECGFRSALCVRLYTWDRSFGALTLYSPDPDAFDETARAEAHALAAHAAIAIVSAQHAEHLHRALDTRTTIALALGMLMERFDLSHDDAFGVLRRVSSHENRKLHQVAAELVATRLTPGQAAS